MITTYSEMIKEYPEATEIEGFLSDSQWTKVYAADQPTDSGACHHYFIVSSHFDPEYDGIVLCELKFQLDPINEVGVNGIQHVDLLHIIRHRLVGFQNGSHPNTHNVQMMAHIDMGLAADQARTTDREIRGVEGTNEQ